MSWVKFFYIQNKHKQTLASNYQQKLRVSYLSVRGVACFYLSWQGAWLLYSTGGLLHIHTDENIQKCYKRHQCALVLVLCWMVELCLESPLPCPNFSNIRIGWVLLWNHKNSWQSDVHFVFMCSSHITNLTLLAPFPLMGRSQYLISTLLFVLRQPKYWLLARKTHWSLAPKRATEILWPMVSCLVFKTVLTFKTFFYDGCQSTEAVVNGRDKLSASLYCSPPLLTMLL